MSFLLNIYQTVFYQPILNALVFLYNKIPGTDIGIAIIIITILVRLILWPLSAKALRSQKAMQLIQPKLKALQEQHKGNKEALARATMELYASEKVSPFSSCLPLIIQFPFLIAIYQALRDGLASKKLDQLYGFVHNPGTVDPNFLGLMNLGSPSIPLAVLAGAAQFWQSRMLSRLRPSVKTPGAKDEDTMAMMNKQMMYFMPVMTVVIGASLPGGLALYWLATTLLTILQQYISFREVKNVNPQQ